MDSKSNTTMETVSVEVAEALHEDEMGNQEAPMSEMTLNGGNENSVEVLASQTISPSYLTPSTSAPSTSNSGNANCSEEVTRLSGEIELLTAQLKTALETIVQKEAKEAADVCEFEKLKKKVEKEERKRLRRKENFDKLVKGMKENVFIKTERIYQHLLEDSEDEEEQPSQNTSLIDLTPSTSGPSTSASTNSSEETAMLSTKIKILPLPLNAAWKTTAQETSRRLENEEDLGKLKQLVRSLAEHFFVVFDKEVILKEFEEEKGKINCSSNRLSDRFDKMMKNRFDEWYQNKRETDHVPLKNKVDNMEQDVQILKEIANLQSRVRSLAAQQEKTSAIELPTTNEEWGGVPSRQPINDRDALEDVVMPQKYANSGSVFPVNMDGWNGDLSRWGDDDDDDSDEDDEDDDDHEDDNDDDDDNDDEGDEDDNDDGISVMPQSEPTPKAQFIENEETDEESPIPVKRARMTHIKYPPHPKELQTKYKFKRNLQSHVGYYKKERTIPCHICGKKFFYHCFLNPHLKKVHKIGVAFQRGKMTKRRQVEGSRDGKRKKNSEHFQVSSCSSDKYTCHCEKEYTRMSDLKDHIAEMN